MTAHLKRGAGAVDASILATERRIADGNERIIVDLMKGLDTAADEEKVARDLVALARMRRKRGAGSRTSR